MCVSPSGGDASETTAALEFGSRAMKVRTHAVVNSTEVALDAAALAADLSEALTLQAEGGLNGQLLAMEAELRTRQKEMQALEEAQKAEAERREGDLSAALAHSEHVKQQAARAGEEACELRRQLASALRAAEESREKCDDLAAQLADEVTDRRELEESLAVKARDVQLAEQRVEDAMAEAGEAKVELAAAKREAQMMREEASKEEKGATAALAATRGELEGARPELARLRAERERSGGGDGRAGGGGGGGGGGAGGGGGGGGGGAARRRWRRRGGGRRRSTRRPWRARPTSAGRRRMSHAPPQRRSVAAPQRLASVETARRDEAAAAEAAVATLEVQLDVALEALHEAARVRATGSRRCAIGCARRRRRRPRRLDVAQLLDGHAQRSRGVLAAAARSSSAAALQGAVASRRRSARTPLWVDSLARRRGRRRRCRPSTSATRDELRDRWRRSACPCGPRGCAAASGPDGSADQERDVRVLRRRRHANVAVVQHRRSHLVPARRGRAASSIGAPDPPFSSRQRLVAAAAASGGSEPDERGGCLRALDVGQFVA